MDTAVAPLRPRTWASPKLELRSDADDRGVFAREAISAGEVLIELAQVFVDSPARHTIQLEEHLHQAGTGEIDDFINHSCEPNVALDAVHLQFVALRPLAPGDELFFNYLTSEWDMAAPFVCRCGSLDCMGVIRGFSHLSPAQQLALVPLLSPFLRRRLALGCAEGLRA